MKSLHQFGIYHNNIKRALFDNFILQPGHEHYLQEFLIYCYTLDDRINRVIRAFEFTLAGGYTYAQLFNVHPGWHDFFKENAYISGIPKSGDDRLGVNQETVNKVMRHYTDNLEEAIIKSMPKN